MRLTLLHGCILVVQYLLVVGSLANCYRQDILDQLRARNGCHATMDGSRMSGPFPVSDGGPNELAIHEECPARILHIF